MEILCKQLYEATDSVLRSNAEKTLVQFVSSQDALPKCQMLLDRADSSYAQLLAATTLTKLIQGLNLEQRIDIRYLQVIPFVWIVIYNGFVVYFFLSHFFLITTGAIFSIIWLIDRICNILWCKRW